MPCLETQPAALAPTAARREAGSRAGGLSGSGWAVGTLGHEGLCGRMLVAGVLRVWGQDLLLAASIGIPSPRCGCAREVAEGTGRWATRAGAKALPAGCPTCFAGPAVP